MSTKFKGQEEFYCPNGMGIWLVHLFRNLNQSTDLTWRINYIQCCVPLILERWIK